MGSAEEGAGFNFVRVPSLNISSNFLSLILCTSSSKVTYITWQGQGHMGI